jgi:hypothetical protein
MGRDHFGRRQYPPQEFQEPGPDPVLDEGSVSPIWKWAITGAIAAVLLLTMYGVTTHRTEEQHAANPPAATGSIPQTPAGAPPEARRPLP